MKPETIGLVIGGLVPALFFGFTNFAVKASTQQGISTSYYLMFVGLGVLFIGLAAFIFTQDRSISSTSGVFAFGAGMSWALGMSCVAYAISTYSSTISQLTPLFNMNTLVTVVLALWLFAEWKQVKIPQLLLGSLFIVVGGALVARA